VVSPKSFGQFLHAKQLKNMRKKKAKNDRAEARPRQAESSGKMEESEKTSLACVQATLLHQKRVDMAEWRGQSRSGVAGRAVLDTPPG
jgi:hypothetical protein